MKHQEIRSDQKYVKVFNGGFVKLEEISTNAATPSTVTYENLKKNIKKGFSKLEDLPEYRKVKGHNNSIAIVGGGPSLKKHIHELKDFKTILVCGSSHDYVVSEGFIPTYAAICDPDPISVNYYKNLQKETKYLISTGVDETLIDHFKDNNLVLWHCHSQDYNIEEIQKLENKEYHAASGGCTVGLRSISLSILLGYTNLHFFGFDSCLSEEECHAYYVSEQEKINFGKLYTVKLRDISKEDGPSDKKYVCVGYQMAQAHAFKDLYINFGKLFTPTFHGEGLLPDYWKVISHLLHGPEHITSSTLLESGMK